MTPFPFLATRIGSWERAERVSSFGLRTVRAILQPRQCVSQISHKDAAGPHRTGMDRIPPLTCHVNRLGASTGIQPRPSCNSFTAATPVRIRLGTPNMSETYDITVVRVSRLCPDDGRSGHGIR